MEDSIGVEATDELAVMIDTFVPINIASEALGCEDSDYGKSWIQGGGK